MERYKDAIVNEREIRGFLGENLMRVYNAN
jgi:hypothetical protein